MAFLSVACAAAFGNAGAMNDNESPLSDNHVDDRLKAALAALGDAPGETVEGNCALKAARKALSMLSLALIMAGERRRKGEKDTWPWPVN